MLNKVRQFIGNILLRSRLSRSKTRQRKVYSFDQAVSVGIIYDATNRNSYQTILKYIRFLKEERKRVSCIGFINSKDESQFIASKTNDIFITRKDLNAFLLPKGKNLDEFINQEFDVLIDLNVVEHLPLKYITALSKARFKVSGDLPYQRTHCDLTIDISQQKTVEFLIIQIKHYLNQVNKTNTSYAV